MAPRIFRSSIRVKAPKTRSYLITILAGHTYETIPGPLKVKEGTKKQVTYGEMLLKKKAHFKELKLNCVIPNKKHETDFKGIVTVVVYLGYFNWF